ncbi:MAG: hypothetical protein KatS3mg121_0101 [Gammaproteobacteria bacterium]|nr:MAG: hypothetical protein KatS3mg121_0101 [Gammaproteobacteria bacterium]
MRKLREFIATAVLGGLLVILPLVVLVQLAGWLYRVFLDSAAPLVKWLQTQAALPPWAAELATLALVVTGCFVLGLLVRTPLGAWFYGAFDRRVLGRIPGYKLVRDVIHHFGAGRKTLFQEVVLVELGNGVAMTGFVVDEYGDGRVSVFVPTAPNPTSGLVLHTERARLRRAPVSVEEALKTILACGAGSARLHGP